jgi:acetyltransferase-like isoleucine patch superfamily enzyme
MPFNLKQELSDWLEELIVHLPGRVGNRMRLRLWRIPHRNRHIYLSPGVRVISPAQLTIGNNVRINTYAQLNARGGIIIGDDVMIGPYALIWSANHRFVDTTVPMRLQGWAEAKVIIESDVWIASHACIMPGVTIHQGAIVAAGAVVTEDVSAFSIVGGVPAREISKRKSGGASV